MPRFLKSRLKTKGLPPGSLVSLRDPSRVSRASEITVFDYDKEIYKELSVENLRAGMPELQDQTRVSWMDISGPIREDHMAQIGELFDIHPLWLEDVLNPDHRPKMEELDDLIFLILKNVRTVYPTEEHPYLSIAFEQASVLLGPHFVVSFYDAEDEVFGQVKDRLRKCIGRLRGKGAGYLFYSLIDTIVDNYFFALEKLGSEIEELTAEMASGFEENYPLRVMHFKNEILYLKKSAVPLKDSLMQIMKLKNEELEGLSRYFQDALDHATQIVDVTDTYREILDGLLETYRSSVNEKMNEIMKTLTLFTAFFSPLTFIAGIYGMNFSTMPELAWVNGYYFALAFMGIISIGMFIYFRRKSWL